MLTEKNIYIYLLKTDNLTCKNYYKQSHKTLSDTIKETKMLYYNTQITTSENKTETTWNVVKSVTSKKTVCEEIHTLCIDGKIINNHLNIFNSFNDYCLCTAERVNHN